MLNTLSWTLIMWKGNSNNNHYNSSTQGEPKEEDTNNPNGNTIGRDPNKG